MSGSKLSVIGYRLSVIGQLIILFYRYPTRLMAYTRDNKKRRKITTDFEGLCGQASFQQNVLISYLT